MTGKERNITLFGALMIAAVTVMLVGAALAQTETVLHNFQGNSDGATPMSGLVADKAGNLYGTTHFGGGSNALCGAGCGTAFELTPPSGPGGHWTYSILYRFGQSSADGVFPQWALILDTAGNLYGSTLGSATVGSGTVFELSPPAVQGGAWTEKILHNFATPDEAIAESSPLLLDSKGNLYGESQGVLNGLGSIFELSPPPTPGGAWIYKIIFAFPAGGQGAIPRGGLIWGGDGNLYGVTEKGGDATCVGFISCGVAFELVKPATPEGVWTERVLYQFSGPDDGAKNPNGIVFHNGNNLYGTTYLVGGQGAGTIFQLSPPATQGDPWKETVLFTFSSFDSYGSGPTANVIFDAAGNLYTTTSISPFGLGEVLELSPPAVEGGAWTPKVLHNFTGGADGGFRASGLTFDRGNVLFGTTQAGGTPGAGVVFKVQP